MRNLINRLFRRQDCRDDLAHKIARCNGELAAVKHLLDHYAEKQFDPYTVPECWKHAENVQRLHDLREEHAGWMKKLIDLQNRDCAQLGKETSND